MIYVTQLKKLCQNRLAIVLTAVFFFWMKTIIAYYADFSLGVEGTIQYFILWINPIATTLLFFGLSLYIKKPKPALAILLIIDILNTLLLYLNIIFLSGIHRFHYSQICIGIFESVARVIRKLLFFDETP